MSQETHVFKLSPNAAAALEAKLREALPIDSEWRSVPHARFSVKALGVVTTCYKSGKLVVQGGDLATFEARFLEDAGDTVKSSSQSSSNDAILPFTSATIGSDETGKGDYFGPIVVSACYAEPSRLQELEKIGVTDSKKLSDARALRLASLIEDAFDCATVRLDPVEYNETYAKVRNLNPMLATLHARAIHTLVTRNPDVKSVIVDRFANEKLVLGALRDHSVPDLEVVQVPRAERHPVVAAASIVARAAFLDGLDACSERCGTDLHKGAGTPVDVAAKRVVEIGGRELLTTVAKMHFRNTAKIGID